MSALHLQIAHCPGHSWLHRLHPLTKLLWLLAGTVFVFAVRDPWIIVGSVVLVGLTFPLSRLPWRGVRGMRLTLVTALTLWLMQALLTRSGPVLLALGPLRVTETGLTAGVYVAGRLLSVVWLGYLFVFTTEPNDLAYGLMQAGLPYRYGFALITALRLVPVFEQEGQTIYQAQLARGIAYDRGGPRRFFTLARQFFLPLLVSALGKVDALAVSMEGRCFGKYPRRTYLRQVRYTHRDWIALGLLVVGIGASVLLLQ